MNVTSFTRRGFLTMSTMFATMLAACGGQDAATDTTTGGAGEDAEATAAAAATGARETIACDTDESHAIAVSGESASYAAVDVVKTGDADGDEADFYGTNAAVYAEEGATLDLTDVTVTTDGMHANAVFSYGEGTVITIAGSQIETSDNCSGGIMVTGGGTLEASNLSIHTQGNSSAAIRSDRGGGTQHVVGGTYVTDGTGSPVIYSTADVTVEDAVLTSNASQGVVVEGKNSVRLVGCDLTADNNTKNSDKSDDYQAVMVYQSMSGDADEGKATFAMESGSLTNAQGDILFVNNTVADIALTGVEIENADASGCFLRAQAAGWGTEGTNGGHVTLTATGQEISGDIVLDEVSELNCYLQDGSALVGAVNADGTGRAYVELAGGSTWKLTADSHVDALTCDETAIDLAGFTLTVADAAYVEGTAVTGDPIEFTLPASSGAPGGQPPEGGQGGPGGEGGPGHGKGGEPPAKPDGSEPPAMGDGGEPPAKPEGEPPALPAGEEPQAMPGSAA